MPRSIKIFDITGMEVTAIAIAITIFKAIIFFIVPRYGEKSYKYGKNHPAMKGIIVAPIKMAIIVFVSLLLKDFWIRNQK